MRKSMRPISLKRIIEVCSYIHSEKNVLVKDFSLYFDITTRRTREILNEINSMGLIIVEDQSISSNNNTNNFIDLIKSQNWIAINDYFFNNHIFYHRIMEFLSSKLIEEGFSIEELVSKLNASEYHFNNSSVEILLRWGERLGSLQRNLYKNTYYGISSKETTLKEFEKHVRIAYRKLNTKKGLFLSRTYIEIPQLREELCEDLKITRTKFNKQFIDYYRNNLDKVELTGAPTITSTKKSPLNEKRTEFNLDGDVITLNYDLETERKGIEILGKSYYFFALFHT
jgi:hypothetical protein